jgi:hypothetical protein
MSNSIRSYNELIAEKQKLDFLLAAQKELVRYDLQELKAELKPAIHAASFLGKITTRDSSNPLINGIANTAIDLVVKKGLLGRAGWMTRLLVPVLLKNYSSHFINRHKDEWTEQLFSLFSNNGTAQELRAAQA